MPVENMDIEAVRRDFDRDVWCLLGLPVDNITSHSLKALLRRRVASKESCTVLSTINVNWVASSFDDPHFRATIVGSDLVTLDGRPLLWIAKSLGYPMKEVVAGSSFIQELLEEKSSEPPLSLYLYGGEDNSATLALERINKIRGGLLAVGARNPGYGTVEEMSTDDYLAEINGERPDILLVALGAKKGNSWIALNRNRLKACLISHLGATVNFLAGTLHRAPIFFQKAGLEWAWRILQEPKLFSRYAKDGWILSAYLLATIPSFLRYLYMRTKFGFSRAEPVLEQIQTDDEIILTLGSSISAHNIKKFNEVLASSLVSGACITLDFSRTKFVDGRCMGSILLLEKWTHSCKNTLKINDPNRSVKRFFHFFNMQRLYNTFRAS